MPLIDPIRLLRCLSPLLDISTGAIKSEREVDKIYGLMSKYSRKLVSKCIYINILRVTQPTTLDLFMARGGWEMLANWLSDGVTNKNYALIQEVITLLDAVPVTVDRLKETEIAKTVKMLSKDVNAPMPIQLAAKQLLDKWMAIVAPPPVDPMLPVGPASTAAAAAGPVVEDAEEDLDLNLDGIQFNPDAFNSAVESLWTAQQSGRDSELDSTTSTSSSTPLPAASTSTAANDGGGDTASMDTEEAADDDASSQYEVNNRDGKMYIKKNQCSGTSPSLDSGLGSMKDDARDRDGDGAPDVPTSEDVPDAAGGEQQQQQQQRKRSRKDPTIKKAPGGKPPLRTYEALYEDTSPTKEKDVETPPPKAPKSKGKPPMGPSPPAKSTKDDKPKKKPSKTKTNENVEPQPPSNSNAKEPKDAKDVKESKLKSKKEKEKDKSKDRDKESSNTKPSSHLTKSQRAAEEQRQLKLKVKEQKRIAEERRKKSEQEKALQAQRARDEETLKSLNLVALGGPKQKPGGSASSSASFLMGKIPKRPTASAASFADAIGIPGASTSEKEKSGTSKPSGVKKQASTDEKEKKGDEGGAGVAGGHGAPPAGERKRVISMPKVKMTTKTRGLGLIEDMTKGGAAGAEGTKTKTSANAEGKEKASAAAVLEVSNSKSGTKSAKDKETTSEISTTSPLAASKIKKKRTSSECSTNDEGGGGSTKKPRLDDSTSVMETDEDEGKGDTTPSTPTTPPAAGAATAVKKIVGLQESSLFMDALTATTTASLSRDRERRLRRRVSSTTEQTQSPGANNQTAKPAPTTPTTPPAPKPVFNFYRETLTESSNEQKSPEQQDSEEPIPPKSPSPTGGDEDAEAAAEDEVAVEMKEAEDQTGSGTPPPPAMQIKVKPKTTTSTSSPPAELKSILHLHGPNRAAGAPRKSVQWVADDQLKSYFFFEHDETERVNVTKGGILSGFGFGIVDPEDLATESVEDAVNNSGEMMTPPPTMMMKPKNFAEMKLLEKAQEKKLVKRKGLFGAVDIMEEKIEWTHPRRLDLGDSITECEITSQQVRVQEEREAGTLLVFYFTKHEIPDCADESLVLLEPFDPSSAGPPSEIPLEDVPGVTKVTYVQTPEDQARTATAAAAAAAAQQLLLQQQQAALQQFGGGGGGGAFDLLQAQQQQNPNLWGGPAASVAAASNPFTMAAMLQAAAAGGLTQPLTTVPQQQQQPPSLLNPAYLNSYQSVGATGGGGYDHYEDSSSGMRNHGGGGRGGGGGGGGRGRRQFSRFDNGGGGRNQGGSGGRGGRGGDWDYDDRRGGGGGRHFGGRDEGGGRGGRGGGRDFRSGGGGGGAGRGFDESQAGKRERGRVGRTVLCKFFAQGTCKAGAACDFLHPGINGPHRGGGGSRRMNNSGSGAGGDRGDWRGPTAPAPRRWDSRGGGSDEADSGYSTVRDQDSTIGDDQDTSPASPEPESNMAAMTNHRPIEIRDGDGD